MWQTQSHMCLLDPVENLPLHAVLHFTPPHHQTKDFVNGVFWIFLFRREKKNILYKHDYTITVIWEAPGPALTHLFGEVLYDAVFGHLGADGEASLQLFFYARDQLLILLRGKSFNTYNHTALLHQTLQLHKKKMNISVYSRPDRPTHSPERLPDRAASSVDTWKSRRASSTSSSPAMGCSFILARDSAMRTTASSCLQDNRPPAS